MNLEKFGFSILNVTDNSVHIHLFRLSNKHDGKTIYFDGHGLVLSTSDFVDFYIMYKEFFHWKNLHLCAHLIKQ